MLHRRLTLEQLEIKSPCPADWDAMSPAPTDDKSRFCRHCQKHVHDLSAMPRAAAERLVCQNAGNLCVRMSLAPDGQVITLDYRPQKGHRWSWRVWTLVALCGALIAGTVEAMFLGKRMQAVVAVPPPTTQQITAWMGDVAPPPSTRPARQQQVLQGGVSCPSIPRR
jgi:hypothetical protein